MIGAIAGASAFAIVSGFIALAAALALAAVVAVWRRRHTATTAASASAAANAIKPETMANADAPAIAPITAHRLLRYAK